mmetsp:Transcript_8852/g.27213  ORF Transcript_8852/g.27213 Transcript_8852/m.27213 type:complete len:373 (-) Transcript_8852:1398-2516(-)
MAATFSGSLFSTAGSSPSATSFASTAIGGTCIRSILKYLPYRGSSSSTTPSSFFTTGGGGGCSASSTFGSWPSASIFCWTAARGTCIRSILKYLAYRGSSRSAGASASTGGAFLGDSAYGSLGSSSRMAGSSPSADILSATAILGTCMRTILKNLPNSGWSFNVFEAPFCSATAASTAFIDLGLTGRGAEPSECWRRATASAVECTFKCSKASSPRWRSIAVAEAPSSSSPSFSSKSSTSWCASSRAARRMRETKISTRAELPGVRSRKSSSSASSNSRASQLSRNRSTEMRSRDALRRSSSSSASRSQFAASANTDTSGAHSDEPPSARSAFVSDRLLTVVVVARLVATTAAVSASSAEPKGRPSSTTRRA